MFDGAVEGAGPEQLSASRGSLPAGFFADLAIEFAEIHPVATGTHPLAEADKCKYHDHGDGAPPCT